MNTILKVKDLRLFASFVNVLFMFSNSRIIHRIDHHIRLQFTYS